MKHGPNQQSTRTWFEGAVAAAQPTVQPLYIAPGNCLELVGHSPRWTKETAMRLGVPVLKPPGSSKWLINAAAFMAALERAGLVQAPPAPPAPPEPGSVDELAAMRERIGMTRRVGGAR